MRPPGEPMTIMRAASMKMLQVGQTIDFHLIHDRREVNGIVVFEVAGGWEIRVGEGTVKVSEKPEKEKSQGHERGCSQTQERPSAIMDGYYYCPECKRMVAFRGKRDELGNPIIPPYVPKKRAEIAPMAMKADVGRGPRSAPGRRIRTIPVPRKWLR